MMSLKCKNLFSKRTKNLSSQKNGQVQIGKWDYFPEAKSLLIDRIVIRLERKNKVMQWLSKTWESFWSYYEE